MQHALIHDELKQENDHIARLGYRLHIHCDNELSVLATPDWKIIKLVPLILIIISVWKKNGPCFWA